MMGGKTRSMLRLFFAVIGPFDGSVVVFGVCVLNGLRAKCWGDARFWFKHLDRVKITVLSFVERPWVA